MGGKALLIAMVLAMFGCDGMTELRPGKCESDRDCKSGQICQAKSCVDLDSGIADALNSQNDTSELALDTLAADDGGTGHDVPAVTDLAAVDAPVVDAPVEDTAIGCRTARDCPGTRSLCVASVCVECASTDDCRDPGKAFCVGGTCVGCEQAGTNACAGKVCAPAGTPDAGGQCVECINSATCTNPAAPICADNSCVACTSGEQCAAKSKAKPACLPSTGTCVACVSTSDCQGGSLVCDTRNNTCVGCTSSMGCDDATPICTGGACVKCATNKQCLDRDVLKPLCSNLGGCAQCLSHSDCGATPGKPYCDPTTNKCEACVTSEDCVSVEAPICLGKVCMKCGTHKQCADRSPATQGCSSSGKCVGCTEKSHCSSTPMTPECELTSNKCVQCLDDSGCSGATPLCQGNRCVACSSNDQCNKKNAATPACLLTGAKAGSCVECKDDSTCSQVGKVCNLDTNLCVQCVDHTKCSGTTPLCSGNQCVSCNGMAATECKTKSTAQPACAPTGACVQCTDNTDCAGNGNLLVCKPDTYTCVQCLDDSKCGSTTKRCKIETNACVQCLGNPDCSGTKPICDANNVCQPCQKDNECSAIGAGVDGVCMLDGHCTTAGETIVVSATSGTLPVTAADIPSGKNLLIIQGSVSGSLTWNLTSRTQPMAIAGQNTGTLSGSLPIYVSGGDLYVKNLTVTGGSPGIKVDTAGTLRLSRVRAVDNQGPGILVDRARFDISNCTVTGNGIVGGSGIRLMNLSSITTGPKSLTYLSVSGNSSGGVACDTDSDAPLTASGVLATGNSFGDVAAACKFTPCTTASSSCGVQP